MSKARDILRLKDLRRLLALRDSLDKITNLMEKRDQLLGEARLIDEQVSELLTTRSGPRRSTTPRGLSIRALCEEVLRRRKHPLTPAEFKDAILRKYPHRNSRTFYNQVFIALSRNHAFRRMVDGRFRLRKRK